MDSVLDPAVLRDWLNGVAAWIAQNATDRWILIQLGLLVVTYLLAWLLSRRLGPGLEHWLTDRHVGRGIAPVIRGIRRVLRPAVFLLLLWLVIGVMERLAWPSASYLLNLVASLLTAWVIIRFGSAFIRNAALAHLLAVVAWSIAALNITNLLEPTIDLLDSFAITLGELRLSVLTVLKAVLSMTALVWAASVLSRLLESRINRMPDLTPSVQVLLGKLVKFGLLAFAVVVALNTVGIDLTALAVFSGAVGVGLGFGLQKVVSNLVSGVILLLDKSIKPGDVIELGETFGWITSLGARYVSVVTRDGKEFLIPNEDLITQRVINWSYTSQLVRLEIPFGVSYGSDPHRVRELAREAAAKSARVDAGTPPVCHLTGFGDSSLDFLLRFWVRDPQNGVVNVKGEVLLALWDTFKANGIAIPYPHRQVILGEPAKAERAEDAAGQPS